MDGKINDQDLDLSGKYFRFNGQLDLTESFKVHYRTFIFKYNTFPVYVW